MRRRATEDTRAATRAARHLARVCLGRNVGPYTTLSWTWIADITALHGGEPLQVSSISFINAPTSFAAEGDMLAFGRAMGRWRR